MCGLLLGLSSCASVKPYYANNSLGIPSGSDTSLVSDIKYSLYLVGGLSLQEASPVLKAIEADQKVKNSGLLLLGDVLSVDDLPAVNKSLPSEAISQSKISIALSRIYS